MPCEVSSRHNGRFKSGKIDVEAKWIYEDSGTNDWPSRRIFRVNTDAVTRLNFHSKFLELERTVKESSSTTVELFDAYDLAELLSMAQILLAHCVDLMIHRLVRDPSRQDFLIPP